MDELYIVITEDMVARFAWLAPLLGKRFRLRRMFSKFGGVCLITGRRFKQSTDDVPIEIGYVKVCHDDKDVTITALACEAEEQMASGVTAFSVASAPAPAPQPSSPPVRPTPPPTKPVAPPPAPNQPRKPIIPTRPGGGFWVGRGQVSGPLEARPLLKVRPAAVTVHPAVVQVQPAVIRPNVPHWIARFRIDPELISPEQQMASDIFEFETCNIIEESRAGGGKTTMLKHHASFRKSDQRIMYLAFNKKNAREGKKKLPREVQSLTTHSFMGGVIRDNQYNIGREAEKTKMAQILNDLYPHLNNRQRKQIRKAAMKLCNLAKAFACRPDDLDGIRAVMAKYKFNLDDPKDYEDVVELVGEMLKMALPSSKWGLMYDFNDMLWWPIVLDMTFPSFYAILADECQDFNMCQIEMLRRLALAGARLVIVGDPFQAVYRFRGADSEAWGKLCNMLRSLPRGAKDVLFPTNYRCCKAVIDFVVAHTRVKDIKAAPNAPQGSVNTEMSYGQILEALIAEYGGREEDTAQAGGDEVKVKTAIAARTNAITCSAAFDLVKAGCPVQIMGTDIASELKEVIGEVLGKRNFKTSLEEFTILLDGWMAEVRKSCTDGNDNVIEEKAEYLAECEESASTLRVIAERCIPDPQKQQARNVQLLIDKINTYFIESDKVNPNAIVCCTGHRIKGLEYKRCIVLRPDLCPHPKAEGEEELAQEENIWYVMLTRAIDEMWVCYDTKPE
jgi:hypothetical protein